MAKRSTLARESWRVTSRAISTGIGRCQRLKTEGDFFRARCRNRRAITARLFHSMICCSESRSRRKTAIRKWVIVGWRAARCAAAGVRFAGKRKGKRNCRRTAKLRPATAVSALDSASCEAAQFKSLRKPFAAAMVASRPPRAAGDRGESAGWPDRAARRLGIGVISQAHRPLRYQHGGTPRVRDQIARSYREIPQRLDCVIARERPQ